jgi:hypothetical protein
MSGSFAPLEHPFVPLPEVSKLELHWIVCFYHPKHSDGDRTRLDRLERQVRMVISMASSVILWLSQARHACMRSEQARDKIKINRKNLIAAYKVPKEEEEKCHARIGNMFLQKRHLLNILLFVFANESLISEAHKKDLKGVESLIQDDTTDWMEILDFSETYFKCM